MVQNNTVNKQIWHINNSTDNIQLGIKKIRFGRHDILKNCFKIHGSIQNTNVNAMQGNQ